MCVLSASIPVLPVVSLSFLIFLLRVASGDLSFDELYRCAHHSHGFTPLLGHTLVVELMWSVMRLLGEGGSQTPCRGGRINDLGRGWQCSQFWMLRQSIDFPFYKKCNMYNILALAELGNLRCWNLLWERFPINISSCKMNFSRKRHPYWELAWIGKAVLVVIDLVLWYGIPVYWTGEGSEAFKNFKISPFPGDTLSTGPSFPEESGFISTEQSVQALLCPCSHFEFLILPEPVAHAICWHNVGFIPALCCAKLIHVRNLLREELLNPESRSHSTQARYHDLRDFCLVLFCGDLMTCDLLPVSPGKRVRTFKRMNLFQSELFRDFQTSILERRDSHFSEIVVWWLDLVTGSHSQRAQILFQTFPPKLESACDDSIQSVAFCHWILFPTWSCLPVSGFKAQQRWGPFWHGLQVFTHLSPKLNMANCGPGPRVGWPPVFRWPVS